MTQPHLAWDFGTAYDFFVSLQVLYAPDKWGLRGAWAAGVRSRLSAENREFLRDIQSATFLPLNFVYNLPTVKDAQAVLDHLTSLPSEQRFDQIVSADFMRDGYPEIAAVLFKAAESGRSTAADARKLSSLHRQAGFNISKKEAELWLYWWKNKAEFGEKIVPALTNYFNVFFAEEEVRIQPYLVEALDEAREKAERLLDLDALIEELTGGVRFEQGQREYHDKTVLVPSFWCSPFLIRSDASPELGVYLFGARADTTSLVPGEVVPDTLYRTLKALADPTRLKIMKYLAIEPQTPTELANKLRLRPPTVIHHLRTLRLAQLVYVTISADGKRYAARTEAIESGMALLSEFLTSDQQLEILEIS